MTDAIIPPIVVVSGADCAFYRTAGDAARAPRPTDSRVFDADGRRLVVDGDVVRVASHPDAGAELADVLRAWLGAMDALRESTAGWPLSLLVRASVEHLGYDG